MTGLNKSFLYGEKKKKLQTDNSRKRGKIWDVFVVYKHEVVNNSQPAISERIPDKGLLLGLNLIMNYLTAGYSFDSTPTM